MNTQLNHIQNWPELIRETNWSVSALAEKCNVSVRTLERFFLKQMGKSPKAWMAEQRHQRALELLCVGSTVKEVAGCLGYKTQHHFSSEFKKQTGWPPSKITVATGSLTIIKNLPVHSYNINSLEL